jgi:hypothetical protein
LRTLTAGVDVASAPLIVFLSLVFWNSSDSFSCGDEAQQQVCKQRADAISAAQLANKNNVTQ